MFSRIKQILWGDISAQEAKEFSLLSVAFFFIVGAYWMLRLIKNSTFMHLVGPHNLPYAKMVSLVSLFTLVLFYNKLVDWFEKNKLLYIISTFYGMLFLTSAYLLSQSSAGANVLPTWLNSGLGWAIYIATESLGSLVVALFWSFVAGSVNTASAKRGYPVIVFGGQIGALLGAILLSQSNSFGVPFLSCIAAAALLVVPFIIKLYISKHAHIQQQATSAETKKSTGIIEGLRLIFTRPYLMGILVVSTVYEVIGFLFEYQMNSAAHSTFNSLEKVTSFLGLYGIATNGFSFLFALLGTSFVIRRFGLTACLVAYPVGIACLVVYTLCCPGIWSFLIAVVGTKALSYALNNPCKELMYIPTSRDVKFKAKSWIDVQGSRSGKATGAVIASFFSSLPALLMFGSIISLGIIAVWIPIALFVGKKNEQLERTNTIID
jgi:AAA family ATP:ADP antiporter